MQFLCPICKKLSRPSDWTPTKDAEGYIQYPHTACLRGKGRAPKVQSRKPAGRGFN